VPDIELPRDDAAAAAPSAAPNADAPGSSRGDEAVRRALKELQLPTSGTHKAVSASLPIG
jgi:hypothetical protein